MEQNDDHVDWRASGAVPAFSLLCDIFVIVTLIAPVTHLPVCLQFYCYMYILQLEASLFFSLTVKNR